MAGNATEQMKEAINLELIRTGEKEKLKHILRERLQESGWRDHLKKYCKHFIEDNGIENITVDDLVKEITPQARKLVHDSIKKELLFKIRHFLSETQTFN